jgi:hypothetical protein
MPTNARRPVFAEGHVYQAAKSVTINGVEKAPGDKLTADEIIDIGAARLKKLYDARLIDFASDDLPAHYELPGALKFAAFNETQAEDGEEAVAPLGAPPAPDAPLIGEAGSDDVFNPDPDGIMAANGLIDADGNPTAGEGAKELADRNTVAAAAEAKALEDEKAAALKAAADKAAEAANAPTEEEVAAKAAADKATIDKGAQTIVPSGINMRDITGTDVWVHQGFGKGFITDTEGVKIKGPMKKAEAQALIDAAKVAGV